MSSHPMNTADSDHRSGSNALTVIYTGLALIAFAGNSVLCRLALQEPIIDASSFSAIRLISGAAVLLILAFFTSSAKDTQDHQQPPLSREFYLSRNWRGPVSLFIYAVGFSYAYLSLETGTGALILFASVQLTLVTISLWQGKRLSLLEWLGIVIAFSGFMYLLYPSLSQPSLFGFILMMSAGIAWGFYTLSGQNTLNPITQSRFNFVYSLPLVLILFAATYSNIDISWRGFWLASVSGGLSSGLGYALWYKALDKLSLPLAGILQLLVPVIATLGGLLFAGEAIGQELLIAGVLIIGGIALSLIAKRKR